MSGGFGSLYYTDCRPGQGLVGGAGFQFQAASAGISPEALQLVQRSALYEPPVRWMRERRPVTDYPPSLAHTVEGGMFSTAAGRYLGQEVNGTREGNQFTHAVVTRDLADYGLVRPAQLWGAPWWALGPAPVTTLAELAAHPEPGPLDVETVRDRVRAAEGGEARLTALLSAIHHLADPGRRRTVVLVTGDPEVAACWIAAATLLLAAPDALRVSFKIYVADGQYGRHDIIALHPDWAGRWADTAAGSGLAVFDLDRGAHTTVETTAAACFWVPRLLAEDPYDVVDAVELAGQFARARAAGAGEPTSAGVGEPTRAGVGEPTRADRLAAVVVAGERLTGPEPAAQAADWLLSAPEDALRIACDPVLAAVLAAAPGASVLRALAGAAASRGWVSAGPRIRRGLLTAEIGDALRASDGVAALRMLIASAPLPPLDCLSEDRAVVDPPVAEPPVVEPPVVEPPVVDPQPGCVQIEQALRGARPDQVPLLLTVAARHAATPVTANFRDAAAGFAAWWVTQPDPDFAPDRWPVLPEALDWVRDVLRDWLAGPRHAYAVEAIRARWWRPLWREACDPGDELDRQLMSVAYQYLKGAERHQLMRDVQEWAFARMVGQAHPSTVAWEIVFDERTPEVSEAATFLAGVVDRGWSISPEVGAGICAALELAGVPSPDGLRMIDQLRSQGHPVPPSLAQRPSSEDAVVHAGPKPRRWSLRRRPSAGPDQPPGTSGG